VHNATNQVVVFKTSAGTGVSIPVGSRIALYCNATNVVPAVDDLPAASKVAGIEIVTISGTQTLTNKTISADNNTLSGIAASSFVLSNASGNIDGAAAQKAIPSGVVVGTTDTQTLTNKTINLTSNTLVATSAQLASALTDETGTGVVVFSASPALTGTPTAPTAAAATNTTQIATTAHVFAERTNTATLTNKTLTSPTINGGTSNPTTLQENGSPAVVQSDVGTAPNQLPLNQYLGNLAYQNADAIAGPVGVGGALTVGGAATMAAAAVTGAVEAGGGAVAEQLVANNFTASSSAVLRGGSTNLLLQSEDFSTTWSNTRSSEETNVIVAPDGTLTGDRLVIDTTANNSHSIFQTVSVTSGTTYTWSVFAKASQFTQINLRFSAQFPSGNANFDLLAGTVADSGTVVASSITPVGNGWYRCSLSQTANSTGAAGPQIFLASGGAVTIATANGSDGVFIWGAQLEASSTVGPYLKTVAAAVTTAYAAPIESPNGLALPLLASMTPARNGDMTFELASDTSLVVKVRGSDGTVRSATLTLA
jgi:hypothetical protein